MGRRSHNRRVPKYIREQQGLNRVPHVIAADVSKQAPHNSYDPLLFYIDTLFVCRDCGVKEIWTAEDQQWWYEVCKGPIYSRAVRCRECRRLRREQHAGSPRISSTERWERRQQQAGQGDKIETIE